MPNKLQTDGVTENNLPPVSNTGPDAVVLINIKKPDCTNNRLYRSGISASRDTVNNMLFE